MVVDVDAAVCLYNCPDSEMHAVAYHQLAFVVLVVRVRNALNVFATMRSRHHYRILVDINRLACRDILRTFYHHVGSDMQMRTRRPKPSTVITLAYHHPYIPRYISNQGFDDGVNNGIEDATHGSVKSEQ